MSFDTPVTIDKVKGNYLGVEPGQSIQASGVSGTSHYAEDWMIEKQRMDIHYVRVPYRQFIGVTSSTLSAVGYTFTTAQTILQANIVATYSREKVNAAFDSSGYVQPQTFQLAALSADVNGMTYGTPAEFTASTMGPAGSILTDFEFYHRRKWATNDTEVNETCNGWNFHCVSAEYTPNVNSYNQVPFWGNLDTYPNAERAGTPWDDTQHAGFIDMHGPTYYINGPYAYNKESNMKMVSFINYCGSMQTNYYSKHCSAPVGIGNNNCALGDQGCDGYDTSRHLFT